MNSIDQMDDLDLKGRFIAQAFVDELEEIEKVAFLPAIAQLGRAAVRTGAKAIRGTSTRASSGARVLKEKAGLTDWAKFYGGKAIHKAGRFAVKNPGATAAIGGVGVAGGTAAALS